MTMEFNEEIVSSVVEKVIAALNKGGPCQPRVLHWSRRYSG